MTWNAGRLTVFGEPFFDLEQDSLGQPTVRDTNWAGARIALDGPFERVPRPPGVTAFLAPRAIQRERGLVDVVWTEPSASSRQFNVRYLLRTAAWNGRRWSDLKTLGSLLASRELSRQAGSDLSQVGRGIYLAFVAEDSATRRDRVVLAYRRADEWTVRSDTVSLATLGSIALGDLGGEVVALVLGTSLSRRGPAGVSVKASAWLMRFDGRGWSEPAAVGGDGLEHVRNPQLLTTKGGLIGAWVRRSERPSLEWRLIARDGALGPTRSLDGVRTIVSGQGNHLDLLSVLMEDGTGRALRLRADGYDEVGRYPGHLGFVFAIGGPPGKPLAFVVDTLTPGGKRWPTFAAYALACEPDHGGPSAAR